MSQNTILSVHIFRVFVFSGFWKESSLFVKHYIKYYTYREANVSPFLTYNDFFYSQIIGLWITELL